MSKRLVSVALICLGVAAAGAARANAINPIRSWNGVALDTVRSRRASDADAARLYAMVNVAMFDAMNALVSRGPFGREQALVPGDGAPPFADLAAAAVAAAHTVLLGVYPVEQPRFQAQLDADLAALGGRPGVTAGLAWGQQVGQAVLAARANDGSSPVETQPAGSGPGVFPLAWSGVQYRNLVPFGIVDSGVYVSDPPPELDSLAYATSLAEVDLAGDALIASPENQATFQYWSLSGGSVQPPGEWLKIALELGAARGLSMYEESRLYTLETMATADAVAPTVMTKWIYRHWRPQHAIRGADTDGNPWTQLDGSWSARAGNPGTSPQHTSGHSTFSGAGSQAIALFFCQDEIAFSHVSDSSGGASRSYPSLSYAASEAGRSRVLGGIHFEFSNQAGLQSGRGVATEVLGRKLLRKFGPTRLGNCPL